MISPETFPLTPEQMDTLGPATYLALPAGTSIAGILLIGLVYGKTGFRELGSRLLASPPFGLEIARYQVNKTS